MNQDQTKNMELIKAALQKQGITDPKYIAATLGNVMKESGGKSQTESLNYGKTDNSRIRAIFGSRAAGKSDAELNEIKGDQTKMGEMMYGKDTKIGQQMGNNEPGDGFKYRGRGFIQLTGKSNYAAASKAIYGDDRLVKNPDLVNDPAVAAEVSAWYMKKGKSTMAKSMGIDENNMSQEQANLLATSQIAGRDVKKAGGYLGGENLSKVNAYASQMAGVAGAPATQVVKNTSTVTPTTSAAQTAVTQSTSAATTQAAADARTTAAATDPRRTDAAKPQTAVAGARQETPESLLASLNTKMDQLISINRKLSDVNERQLSRLGNIAQNGDLYSPAM
jgi:predicted chitinase